MSDYFSALWVHWVQLMSGVIGLLIGIGLRAGRRVSTTIRSWSDIPDWLFIIIGVVGLFWAGYLAWKDQQDVAIKTTANLTELSMPKLRGNIDFFVSSEAGQELGIMMVVTIYNTGAPTIVEQYRLLIEPQGGPALPIARPSQLTDEQIWHSPEPGGPAFRFLRSESLIDKTVVNPIIKGGSAKGNILFVVQNSGIITRTTPKIKLTLSFRDINNKEWFTTTESTLAIPKLQGFPGLQSGPVPAPQQSK